MVQQADFSIRLLLIPNDSTPNESYYLGQVLVDCFLFSHQGVVNMSFLLSPVWLWVLAALALFGIEMLLGTFYLLVLSIGCLAGALLAFTGVQAAWQFTACAVFAIVGGFVIHRMKQQSSRDDKQAQQLQNLDVGQTVSVTKWLPDGSAQVQYRGSVWLAKAAPNVELKPGIFTIEKIDGSCLILHQQLHP